jgi:pimeloyl-ACP methyl ester carboxylesterase
MAVAARLAGPTSAHITADGIRLHYLDWGDPARPPLVLLHGGSAHAHWWDFVVPHLIDRYRCIALDLRGHGASAWSASHDYGLEAHAADVAALVAALELKHVALVGHSFGGFVAMVHAARPDARLSALVVVDSRVRIGERSARYLDALRKLPHPTYASEADAVRRFRLLPSGSSAAPEVLAHMVHHGIARRPDGTWTLRFDRHALASTPMQDLSPALASVRCPILVIRAQHSTIVSPASLDEYRAANPRVELSEIAGAHHHIMLDQPAALAAVVGDFLSRSSQ